MSHVFADVGRSSNIIILLFIYCEYFLTHSLQSLIHFPFTTIMNLSAIFENVDNLTHFEKKRRKIITRSTVYGDQQTERKVTVYDVLLPIVAD